MSYIKLENLWSKVDVEENTKLGCGYKGFEKAHPTFLESMARGQMEAHMVCF